ncbi:MAG: OmpA family protein [Francisellaceae bacterium]
MKRKLLVGMLTVALCGGAFAAGNNHAGEVYGGMGVGGVFNNKNTSSGPGVNGVLGYQLNPYLGLQVNGLFSSTENSTGVVMFEGIWNVPNASKLTPYLAVGAGYTRFNSNNSGGIDAGLGVKYDLAPNADVSLNYRIIQAFGNNTPVASYLGLGFNLYFGGAATAAYSANQSQREAHYHAMYNLPKNVMECQAATSQMIRESVGCYTVSGDKVTMHLDVKFGYDSYALSDKTKAAVDNLLNFMQQYNITNVTLNGYASQGKTGPVYKAYNEQLSVNRAEAVKSYMVSRGLPATGVEVVGYGYTKPLVPNSNKENKAINRRVEATISVPLKKG